MPDSPPIRYKMAVRAANDFQVLAVADTPSNIGAKGCAFAAARKE